MPAINQCNTDVYSILLLAILIVLVIALLMFEQHCVKHNARVVSKTLSPEAGPLRDVVKGPSANLCAKGCIYKNQTKPGLCPPGECQLGWPHK